MSPTTTAEPAVEPADVAAAPAEDDGVLAQDDGVLAEVLVEEISIDGMCGVY